MTTIFLSGSRQISRLNDIIRARLNHIMERHSRILIGDANGADKAMQGWLAAQTYPHVSVYYAGNICRTNIGEWQQRRIEVEPTLKGRAFYTQKDKAMAAAADSGLALWDGRSEGSFNNILALLSQGKAAAVYFAPDRQFIDITSTDDLTDTLLSRLRSKPEILYQLQGSPTIRRQLQDLHLTDQPAFL